MFQTLSLASFRAGCFLPGQARPGRAAPALAALTVAALAVAAFATSGQRPAAASISAAHPAATLVASSASLAVLQSGAEDLRARLRAVPGVGAVRLDGMQTAGLELHVSAHHLASLGVRTSELLAAVPHDRHATPTRIVLTDEAAQAGPQTVADLPVRAGQRVMRLGDLALVARTPLPAPIARMHRDGMAAMDIVITPAPGEAGPTLDRRVAQVLAAQNLPAGVQLR